MFLGAINAFTAKGAEKPAGRTINKFTAAEEAIPQVARDYKQRGLRWVAVGDENYGEGSSREHAAMSPRFLGAAAVITRSFARIHESNLKKQGVLPLTFVDGAVYDRIGPGDTVSLLGLAGLAPGKPIDALVRHADGKEERFQLKHTLNDEQIGWFKAGSALNLLARKPS
jgi:aconitate hydratase